MEKDGTWQKKPKVYKAGEKYQKKSINGDPMDNRFHAVWAPEMHYIKSAKNWFIVACMNVIPIPRPILMLHSCV